MHQVGPALHRLRREQPHVAVEARELGAGHGLEQVAAGPAGGPLADALVELRQLALRTEALEHHSAAAALAGLAVLREVDVLHVEEVQQAQAAPRLEHHLPVEEAAAPASSETRRALIELQEAPVGQLVALPGGEQRRRVQHHQHQQAAQRRQLQRAGQAAQLRGHQAPHPARRPSASTRRARAPPGRPRRAETRRATGRGPRAKEGARRAGWGGKRSRCVRETESGKQAARAGCDFSQSLVSTTLELPPPSSPPSDSGGASSEPVKLYSNGRREGARGLDGRAPASAVRARALLAGGARAAAEVAACGTSGVSEKRRDSRKGKRS